MSQKKKNMGGNSPFAKNLRTFMSENGLSIRKVAEIAQVSPSVIDAWKNGVAPTDFEAVSRLAESFHTSFSFLLLGKDESRPSGTPVPIAEVFESGGTFFDGFAKITIEKLTPKISIEKKRKDSDV